MTHIIDTIVIEKGKQNILRISPDTLSSYTDPPSGASSIFSDRRGNGRRERMLRWVPEVHGADEHYTLAIRNTLLKARTINIPFCDLFGMPSLYVSRFSFLSFFYSPLYLKSNSLPILFKAYVSTSRDSFSGIFSNNIKSYLFNIM